MPAAPVLTLRPGRERSLKRRHPWIFSGAVKRLPHDLVPGDVVAVRSADGEFLAWAWANPASQIVGRVLSFDEGEAIDAEFIAGRITAAATRRADLASRTDAARLVFSESDGLPGVIADRYGDVVVLELTTAGADGVRHELAEALMALPGVSTVYDRSDADVRKREGLAPRTGLLAGAEPPELVEITEDDHRFLVDVRRGHKTGFYLDQRESGGGRSARRGPSGPQHLLLHRCVQRDRGGGRNFVTSSASTRVDRRWSSPAGTWS
ncbi:MAG: hypothetical protein R2715_06515 [Ilumatobacteraceae bacterium]